VCSTLKRRSVLVCGLTSTRSSPVIDTVFIEIIIQRVKKLTPEEIALRILQFDPELCTESFLKEMKDVLPSPEQVSNHLPMSAFQVVSFLVMKVGKLNVYRNSDPEELATLHLSDRLMVQLIKIDRLGPRLEGMLYKAKFEESFGLVDDVSLR
jgi:cytokinesis protein